MKEHPIEVMINRSLVGKMRPDATPADWSRYHAAFKREQMTARGLAVNVYRGFSFCPVYDGHRRQEHFKGAWHVAFDFDDNGLDALRAVEWAAWYASFGYSTPSSTETAPKCRVVFILESPLTDPQQYRDLYHALAWRFAEAGMMTDPACKDIIRLYYGSPRCALWDNWSILPADVVRWFVDDWREHTTRPEPKPAPAQYISPPRSADEAQIRDALRYIPAWGDYDDWLRVLMAVHSVMPGADGVALVEAWSPGKPGEVAKKFRSFDANRPGGVNLGTLFHMASQNGYSRPAPARVAPANRSRSYDLRSVL